MTTVIAGQLTDLPHPNEDIVMELIKRKYPTTGYLPVRSKIYFSSMGWAGIKPFQISVETNQPPFVTPSSIGMDRLEQYIAPIVIHVWTRKNDDKKPIKIFNIGQKIEHIINESVASVGYGIDSIRLMQPFSTVETASFFSGGSGFSNETEQSLWHTQCLVHMRYFKWITHDSVQMFIVNKTHKYNVLV